MHENMARDPDSPEFLGFVIPSDNEHDGGGIETFLHSSDEEFSLVEKNSTIDVRMEDPETRLNESDAPNPNNSMDSRENSFSEMEAPSFTNSRESLHGSPVPGPSWAFVAATRTSPNSTRRSRERNPSNRSFVEEGSSRLSKRGSYKRTKSLGCLPDESESRPKIPFIDLALEQAKTPGDDDDIQIVEEIIESPVPPFLRSTGASWTDPEVIVVSSTQGSNSVEVGQNLEPVNYDNPQPGPSGYCRKARSRRAVEPPTSKDPEVIVLPVTEGDSNSVEVGQHHDPIDYDNPQPGPSGFSRKALLPQSSRREVSPRNSTEIVVVPVVKDSNSIEVGQHLQPVNCDNPQPGPSGYSQNGTPPELQRTEKPPSKDPSVGDTQVSLSCPNCKKDLTCTHTFLTLLDEASLGNRAQYLTSVLTDEDVEELIRLRATRVEHQESSESASLPSTPAHERDCGTPGSTHSGYLRRALRAEARPNYPIEEEEEEEEEEVEEVAERRIGEDRNEMLADEWNFEALFDAFTAL